MKKLRNIPIIFILFIMGGCRYAAMTHLTDEELEWYSHYELGKDYLYVSDKGNVDTLHILESRIRNSESRFFTPSASDGFSAYRVYNASLYFIFRLYSKYGETDISLVVSKEIGQDSLIFISRVGYTGIGSSYTKISKTDFNLNHSVYEECVVCDADVYEKLEKQVKPKDFYIKRYVWAKREGLIYYELYNGEYFTRVDND